ncbi:hypothetical protein CIK05_15490 [Bdellovibrio sp. qaytius]|nr:hypothetical protein CIK05_15490 [Bdellovibrio sp. qaytius]
MKIFKARRKNVIFVATVISGCLLFLFQNCSKGFEVKEDLLSQGAILDYGLKLDSQYLSSLTTSDNISYWQQDSQVLVDNTPAIATDWSMLAVITNTADGDLVSVNSGSGSEESRMTISGGKITLTQISNASNYAISEFPTTGFNPTTILAFSSGPKISNAVVLVDGYLQKASTISTGTNLDFSLLAKALEFNSSKVKEIIFYPRALNAAELNVMSRHLALKYNLKTVVLDPAVLDNPSSGGGSSGGGGSGESAQALAAVAVINNRCLSCHSSSNNGDFRSLTTSKAIQKQLITAGNLANSKLYYRLSGSSTAGGPKNMPMSGSIPPSEVQAIEAWILSIQ